MKTNRTFKTAVVASACALALVAAVGCSGGTASSSASDSASAATDSASSAAVSASAASAAASSAASSATTSESAASASASAAASTASASSESASAIAADEAVAQGYQVFEGTVYVCTAEELVKLQAIDIDPAAASGGGTYAVLKFDEAVDVTGEQADGSGQDTRSSTMLGIAEHTDFDYFVVEYGDLDLCQSLNGQKVKVAAKAEDIVFPSDVSLPIGEPKAQVSILVS